MSNIIPYKGRRSDGMSEQDWSILATAYDTWTTDNNNTDPDVVEFCSDIFSEYDLWDYVKNEPMLGRYRQMFMERC